MRRKYSPKCYVILTKRIFAVLREAFKIFDSDKKGAIQLEMVKEILSLLGHDIDDEELEEVMEGEQTNSASLPES